MDSQQTCCDPSETLNLIRLCVCQTGAKHWYALRNSMITRYATSNTIAGCTWLDLAEIRPFAKKNVELVSEGHLQRHVTCVTCAFSWQVGHTKLLRSTAGAVRETLCALWMYSLALLHFGVSVGTIGQNAVVPKGCSKGLELVASYSPDSQFSVHHSE